MENKMQFKTQLRKRYEQGLTLIEASMVLALSAVVIAGVMLYYQSASDQNKIMNAQSEIGSIQTVVQSIYGNSMDYSGIATGVLKGSSAIPPNLLNASGAPVTPWGGGDRSRQRFMECDPAWWV
jgi:type II secretory pathway pseudopilin PulG